MAILPFDHLDDMSHQQSIQNPDTPNEEYITIYLDVTTNVDCEDYYEEDLEAVGTFEVRLPGQPDDSTAAGIALGAYFINITNKHLERYQFSCHDEAGKMLMLDYHTDWYDLAEKYLGCRSVEFQTNWNLTDWGLLAELAGCQQERFSNEQIFRILRETDQDSVAVVSKRHGVSDATIYVWRKKFGQLDTGEVKRLKVLEAENARLRKMLVERDLEIWCLKEIDAKNT